MIGGGPAGLMAAETWPRPGCRSPCSTRMPSLGRKFLLAGRGGLNLTHSEAQAAFLGRYGARRAQLAPLIEAFGAEALRAWAHALGIDTFVGSSGRVFPTQMKAAPLLRAWLARLRAAGVHFAVRHRWRGWAAADAAGAPDRASPLEPARRAGAALRHPGGRAHVHADAVVLALGGGSWAKLGSDGAWVPLLRAAGVEVAELLPANCGFDVGRAAADGGAAGPFLPRLEPALRRALPRPAAEVGGGALHRRRRHAA